jgi:multiple sugar transport system substrate-binding protein
MGFTRRDLLKTTAGVTMGAMAPSLVTSGVQAQELKYKPEDGATLRLLRWSPFVKGDEEQWLANTKKFTDATGVQVRPMSARAPISCSYGSTMPSNIPTSCSM